MKKDRNPIKRLDLNALGKYSIIRRQLYFCQECGEETWRPSICQNCEDANLRMEYGKIRK